MKLTKSTVTALVGLALVFAFPLLAQKADSGPGGKACGIPNLTPEQKAAFFRMFEDHVCPREKGAGHGSAGAGDTRCPQEIGR